MKTIKELSAKNMLRRQLSLYERACIADDLANLANGTNQHQQKKVGHFLKQPTFTRPEAAFAGIKLDELVAWVTAIRCATGRTN